jgi:hypothetical protein
VIWHFDYQPPDLIDSLFLTSSTLRKHGRWECFKLTFYRAFIPFFVTEARDLDLLPRISSCYSHGDATSFTSGNVKLIKDSGGDPVGQMSGLNLIGF